jgi:hypothetical protein
MRARQLVNAPVLPVIYIDDQEFNWEDFGQVLCTYAGWGMRIVFVPNDELDRTPKSIVQEPDNQPRRSRSDEP